MREILFRGKRKDNGEWVEGFYTEVRHYDDNSHVHLFIMIPEKMHDKQNGLGFWEEVIPETVGQFTGLTDKNGKKIFEGDVVQYFGTYPLEVFIENGHAKFRFYDTYSKRQYEELFFGHDEEYGKCEVIGNIHDNPELIGGNEE